MKKRIVALVTALVLCVSMFVMPAAAATPAMTGTLLSGKLTVTVTGLGSDISQVTFLAINKDDSEDYRMDTAVVSNNKAEMTFTVTGTDYTVKATPKDSDGADQTALTAVEVKAPGVTYAAHVQSIGWQSFVSDGAVAGTSGKSLRVEALKIKLTGSLPDGASITYQAHVQKNGWMAAVSDGEMAGTSGKALRVEALKLTISGLSGYEVKYRVHQQSYGWTDWVTTENGTDIASASQAGVTGKSKRLEAVEIKIEEIAS